MNKLSLALFDLLKGRKTSYYLNEFDRVRGLSREEVEDYQYQKLIKLLKHAQENSPFFQKRVAEAGISISDIKSVRDLEIIPPLTRSDLQNYWADIIATNYDKSKLDKGSSSGSTGYPVVYYKEPVGSSAGQAGALYGWVIGGWKMGHKGLHIWGNPTTVNNEWKRWSSKLKAKVFQHHKFPAYTLTDGNKFEELRQLILKEKYDYLDGYTNAIYLFADYLKRNNLSLMDKSIYVLTTGENLHDYQRDTIEATIGPVYDSYGCSEINGIAYECVKCRNYHVIDPHVVVEYGDVVDDIGTRELIVTDLDNYAFPLIRYKLNDLAVPEDQPRDCEVPFMQLKSISGRQSDILRFKDGGSLSVPSFFGSMLLKQVKGIKQYQIVRVSEDKLVIRFVTFDIFKEDDLKILHKGLYDYLAGKINYSIEIVDEIKVAKTGKFKLLIDETKS